MMRQPRIILIATAVLALALAVVSYFGAFVPATYSRDAASIAAQGIGQDLFDLFLVVPLLLISLKLALDKNKLSFLIFSGTVFYVLYSYFIYSFGVHFNQVFLLYCLTLGAAFYTFALLVYEITGTNLKAWFGNHVPVRAVGIYLIVIAALFYLLWLKDIVPAILNGALPRDVSQYGLLVNPVHVMDTALALPGILIAAILLMQKRSLGYFLAPVYLVFITLLALALIAMGVVVKMKGLSDDLSLVWIFSGLAAINLCFLFSMFKNIKPKK